MIFYIIAHTPEEIRNSEIFMYDGLEIAEEDLKVSVTGSKIFKVTVEEVNAKIN